MFNSPSLCQDPRTSSPSFPKEPFSPLSNHLNSNHKDTEVQTEPIQGDLNHPLKKRKLNDGFSQTIPTVDLNVPQSQNPKTGSNSGFDPEFPIICEIEDTLSHTCSSSLKEDANMISRTSDIHMGHGSNREESRTIMSANSFRVEVDSLKSTMMHQSLNLRSRETRQNSFKFEPRIREHNHQIGDNRIRLSQEKSKGREPSNFKNRFPEPSPSGSNTPSKRKMVNSTKIKGGSQSVCKMSSSQSMSLWSSQNIDSKPTTPMGSDFYKFKARPMPRYVPFEAKKSDRPCVIPEEFHLMTEERGRLKQELMRKEQQEQQRIESNKNSQVSKLPSFESLYKGTNYNAYKEARASEIRPINQENNRFVSRSVSKDDLRGGYTSRGFRAQPMPDFSKPFTPKVGIAPLTEVDDVVLNTQVRAEKRGEFENFIREKERLKELQQQKEEEERKKQEEEELREYRKTLEFRARPFKDTYSAKKFSIRDSQSSFLSKTDSQDSLERIKQNFD